MGLSIIWFNGTDRQFTRNKSRIRLWERSLTPENDDMKTLS